jgi:hypothetical protein
VNAHVPDTQLKREPAPPLTVQLVPAQLTTAAPLQVPVQVELD